MHIHLLTLFELRLDAEVFTSSGAGRIRGLGEMVDVILDVIEPTNVEVVMLLINRC